MSVDRDSSRDKWGRFLLLAGVILLIVCKRPELFAYPRFWAEEGALYFEYAWQQGFLKSIIAQHVGFYALIPSLSTAIATLLPLEFAPLLTTTVAAAMQLLVSSMVIFLESPFWNSWPKRIVLACAIQLIPPFEVWLTTISSQFWMTVAVFLLLLEKGDKVGAAGRIMRRLLVCVGGLCGGQTVFLLPAYLLKAWQSRNREYRVHAAILFTCGLVQALALAVARVDSDPLLQGRFNGINFNPFRVASLHLIEPYFSKSLFDLPLTIGIDNFSAGLLFRFLPQPLIYTSILAALLLVCGTSLAIFWKNRQSIDHQCVFVSYLSVVAISTLFSLQMASSPRYAFAPAVMLLTMQIGYSDFRWRSGLLSLLSAIFLLLVVFSAVLDFRSQERIYFKPGLPEWRVEVAHWRQDPNYRPMIWPPYMNRRWDVGLSRAVK